MHDGRTMTRNTVIATAMIGPSQNVGLRRWRVKSTPYCVANDGDPSEQRHHRQAIIDNAHSPPTKRKCRERSASAHQTGSCVSVAVATSKQQSRRANTHKGSSCRFPRSERHVCKRDGAQARCQPDKSRVGSNIVWGGISHSQIKPANPSTTAANTIRKPAMRWNIPWCRSTGEQLVSAGKGTSIG